MKVNEKSIFILFLIISSNILSINSNIKYNSKISESLIYVEDSERNDNSNISEEFPFTQYKKEDRFSESQDSSNDSLNISMMDRDDNIIPYQITIRDKQFTKVYNFILGMIKQIPQFSKYDSKLQASINNPSKPECSKEKLIEEFDKPRITAAMKNKAIHDSLKDMLIELGDSDYVKDLDWTNPREACKIVKMLQREKLREARKSSKKSETLFDFAIDIIKKDETFERIEEISFGFLQQLFGMKKSKLLNLIRDLNFNGDNEIMRRTYKNYARWKNDLGQVVNVILKESKEAVDTIKNSILEMHDNGISCDELPETNQVKSEIWSFSEQFLGGLYTLKQVAVCLEIDPLIFTFLLKFGIQEILNLISTIFGFYIGKILYFAYLLTQFTYFLYKGIRTNENTYLKEKFEFFGRAAGVIFNIITSLLFQ